MKKKQQEIANCKICGRDFETTRGLYYHVLDEHHLNERQYLENCIYEFECLECGVKKKSKYSLTRHINAEHSLIEYYLKYIDSTAGTCKHCGKPMKFIDLKRGFRDFCNSTCANYFRHANRTEEQKKSINEKIRKTNQSEKTKQKARKTCLERYGVDNASKSDEVKEKIKQKHLELFGSENAFQSSEVKEKIKKTCLDKYGFEFASQSPNFKEKVKRTVNEKIRAFELENDCTLVKRLELKHVQKIISSLDIELLFEYDRSFIRNTDLDLPKFLELNEMFEKDTLSSSYELEIFEWLQSIYFGKIHTNRYDIIRDDEAKQLDFYIPEKKLAIEFNGNYYHSVNTGKDKNYHLNKTKLCKEKGIRLIHIFEYEWTSKKNICKSIVSSALGIYKNQIYARNCEFREVNLKEAKEFLNINHLQGSVNSSYQCGLYFENQLIQFMCFGKNRFKKNETELLRTCTRLNTQVIGGFSKLLKHQPFDNFVSYLDLSKFNASGYLKNNFDIVSRSSPNYKYVKNEEIVSRQRAQKHRLPKLLGDNFDNSKTESQNMIENGWLKIYDCGNLKLEFTSSMS